MTKESDIVYEDIDGVYWVLKVRTGFEVYQNKITHSVRRARVGYKGDIGLTKCKEYINQFKGGDYE